MIGNLGRLCALILVPALVVGSCGISAADDISASPTEQPPASDEPTATELATPKPAADDEQVFDPVDQGIAGRAALKLDDMRGAWIQAPPSDPEEDSAAFDAVPACAGIQTLERARDESGLSDLVTFAQGDDDLDNRVRLWSDESRAIDFIEVWSSDDVFDCHNAVLPVLLSEDLPPSLSVSKLTIERLRVEEIGDDRVAWRMTVALTVGLTDEPDELELVVDQHFVRIGRAVVSITARGFAQPIHGRESFMALMVERLQADHDL